MWRSVQAMVQKRPLRESLCRMKRPCHAKSGFVLAFENFRSFSSKGDGGDEEGWVPPVRNFAEKDPTIEGQDDDDGSYSPPKSKRIETILQVSKQVKDQERMDRTRKNFEDEMDALLQLTDDEQATLTEEEILAKVEEALQKEEEMEEALFRQELENETILEDSIEKNSSQKPDWLQTRRATLGRESIQESAVPVLEHTLLTAEEIQLLLEEYGGTNIRLIEDDPEAPRMGGAIGMIFCTSGGTSDNTSIGYIDNSPYLISTLSRVLIDHMKDRKLDELGKGSVVPGALENTKNRSGAVVPSLYGSSNSISSLESWKIVDCGNYIVHIMDDMTRNDLRLEDLWSGFDPLWRLNILDDDAVDDYCEQNPVPTSFDGSRSNRSSSAPAFDDAVLKRLERNQVGFQRRHKPVIPQSLKNKDRRAGRKRRRLQRERGYFGVES